MSISVLKCMLIFCTKQDCDWSISAFGDSQESPGKSEIFKIFEHEKADIFSLSIFPGQISIAEKSVNQNAAILRGINLGD